MKLSIIIPVFNQLATTRACWGCLCASTVDKANSELIVIDNASADESEQWISRYVFNHFSNRMYIKNTVNTGALPPINLGCELSSGEILAIFHNDLCILDKGWDQNVREIFDDPSVGLVGFCGAKGIGVDGGRWDTMSNMLDAELHGNRVAGVHEVAALDSFALILRGSVFRQIGEIGKGYDRHHFYDKDLCMTVRDLGYRVMLAGVFCHHEGGLTALSPEWQKQIGGVDGERALYARNQSLFMSRWGHKFPFRVP